MPDLLSDIERNYLPTILLLDPKLCKQHYTLKVRKSTPEYHILDMVPERRLAKITRAQVFFSRGTSAEWPEGTPRLIWFADERGTYRYDITRWETNPKDPPKPEDFAVHREKDGWRHQVIDWDRGLLQSLLLDVKLRP
jgi:hypothetical protein